jgi:hypothetical protein
MTPGDVFRFVSKGRERGMEGVVARCGSERALLCVRGRWHEDPGVFEPETSAPRIFYASDIPENMLLLGHISKRTAEEMEQHARQPLRNSLGGGATA